MTRRHEEESSTVGGVEELRNTRKARKGTHSRLSSPASTSSSMTEVLSSVITCIHFGGRNRELPTLTTWFHCAPPVIASPTFEFLQFTSLNYSAW